MKEVERQRRAAIKAARGAREMFAPPVAEPSPPPADRLLLTLSGCHREDTKLFYAGYVLVEAPESERAKVGAFLAGKLQARDNSRRDPSMIEVPFAATDSAGNSWDELLEEPEELVALLREGGYQASVLTPTFVLTGT